MENVLGYPLLPTFYENEYHKIHPTVFANRGNVSAVGRKSVVVLSANVPTDNTDPDVLKVSFVPAVPITNTEEVHVFYPGTFDEIIPSNITYDSGTGTLEILIPKCRAIAANKLDNPPSGWFYDDPTVFQATVDVSLILIDSTVQGQLIYRSSPCQNCTSDTEDICLYIADHQLGSIKLGLHDAKCRCYEGVLLNYKAGLRNLPRNLESALLRLAHSMMPQEPCGCSAVHQLWARDREIPQVLTQERIECPFGESNGAWYAWKVANTMRLVRLSVLI